MQSVVSLTDVPITLVHVSENAAATETKNEKGYRSDYGEGGYRSEECQRSRHGEGVICWCATFLPGFTNHNAFFM
jgi:hypothetical protein